MPENSIVAPQSPPYFQAYMHREPPKLRALKPGEKALWQMFAAATLGLAIWYLHWRWTQSLNPEAMVFSIIVASAETLAFLGSALFFFDIWDEQDTPSLPFSPPQNARDLPKGRGIHVDIFITTFDEDIPTVTPSIAAAKALRCPEGVRTQICLLDDGNRPVFQNLARREGITYLCRDTNRGYKAGNLAHALFATKGDYFVICDADTQLFPSFLENTLGYFSDPKVSWVQTPHWFFEIPQGRPWPDCAEQKLGKKLRWLGHLISCLKAQPNAGADPFLCESMLFFDVIQRRRNRNGASFCCGAGSIHRREAVFQSALCTKGHALAKLGRCNIGQKALLPRLDLQPFKFHVSEDLFTSILHHGHGWKSVYHPHIEARMLSPWSMKAWALQRLKYAGGTYDIMLRGHPLRRKNMGFATKLHYLATFWSYLSALWLPVLLLAPVISIALGTAPIAAYSVDFFLHLLPVLLMNELALVIGCKGHDLAAGRIASIGALHIQLKAFFQVLRGKRPRFAPTPKTPKSTPQLRYVEINIALLVLLVGAAAWAIFHYWKDTEGYSRAFLTMNLFWLGWSGFAIWRVMRMGFWSPLKANPTPQGADPC